MINEKQLEVYKKKYANLIVRIGLRDVKNRYCKIEADLDDPNFVFILVKELYKYGAKRVFVYWKYRPLLQTIYRYTSTEELSRVYSPELVRTKFEKKVKMLLIRLESSSPDWMGNIDPRKVAEVQGAHHKAIKPYRTWASGTIDLPWCVAIVPGKEWAKKLFPNDDEPTALLKFWDKVIDFVRLKGDPIKNWMQYNKDIHKRADWLTSLNIESLHYTSDNGTDLIVGVHPDVVFMGGCHKSDLGHCYNPNIPSVECFTTPDRYKTEGVVYATRPLVINGELVEGFSLRFHRGKVVKVKARKGEELLKKVINTDKNSCYLGEAALVPFDSPISNTKMIYFTTLLDENASCHFALGAAIGNTFKEKLRTLNEEKLNKIGVNCSVIHIDFMIGNKNLNITAKTRDGRRIPIFRDGNWAKEL